MNKQRKKDLVSNFGLPAEKLAERLIGAYLVHRSPEGTTIGEIIETEAYLHTGDSASHSARGMTPGNQAMFLPGGHVYVYFIYGMYHCFNVVSGKKGHGEAVLIRALRPVEGLELMEKRLKLHRRKRVAAKKQLIPPSQLCNGPGKLVIAMGITKEQNGMKLNNGPLLILKADRRAEIVRTVRIGISSAQDLKLRFLLKE